MKEPILPLYLDIILSLYLNNNSNNYNNNNNPKFLDAFWVFQ